MMGSKESVVVSVAPMIEVVPLMTGVTVTVKGGGCTELVKMMGTGPPVELELALLGRETPQTSMAVVVKGGIVITVSHDS